MKNLKSICLIAVGLALSVALVRAQSPEPSDLFLGTWKLNVAQSKYPPGACPRQMTIEMTMVADGIHYVSETTYADGRNSRSEYTAAYGAREVLVKGSVGLLLPVSLKRIDPHTVEATYTRGLQPVATSRRVVSADGRVMTITTTSPAKPGQNVTTVSVYDKSEVSVKTASAQQ
jgi:hypothetical protein